MMTNASSADLTPDLAKQIRNLHASSAESSLELAVLAASVRNLHLRAKKRRKTYSKNFKDWWIREEMPLIFGGLPTFTRYAKAGEAITVLREIGVPEARTPTAISTLYALSQIPRADLQTRLAADQTAVSPTLTASQARRLVPSAATVSASRRLSFPTGNDQSSSQTSLALASIRVDQVGQDAIDATKVKALFGQIGRLLKSAPYLKFEYDLTELSAPISPHSESGDLPPPLAHRISATT